MTTKYGVKIRNYSAAVIDEYNRGLRKTLSYTKATLPNSILNDFLQSIGMKVHKNTTKDVICVKYDFGTHGYNHEKKKIQKKIDNAKDEKEKLFFADMLNNIDKNKDSYIEQSRAELRLRDYAEGITIKYSDKETIRYRMLWRSAGKAKLGQCMYINEKLYAKAADFLHLGMELPEENSPIVEIGAYSSLVASSIVDKITIHPDDILVLKDVESVFNTNIISVEVDENKHCIAKDIKDYPLKNVLFDGQALIDDSIFPEWAEGYILLRHHFCKMAAFHTNIQEFFKDHYGDQYETAAVKDMWGREIKVKDIKLITTDNAMKWIKFDVSYDYWASKILEANNAQFGIVKTAHPSKLGEVQRMSYQMINALNLQAMDSVIKTSREFIKQLKTSDEVFIKFLKDNINFANDYEVLVDLYEKNPEFSRSSYFRERRSRIISDYVLDFKNGRVLQNADNLVIVGSPYAMLLHSVGKEALEDDTFQVESGVIQCFTERFEDGAFLASFRSPFNSQNNLCHLHNVHNDLLKKYFHIGRQCIAVNLIGTDFQARNNGSDQDSDSVYTTDHKEIVSWAKHCVENFPTIENRIPKETNHYRNTMADFSEVDTKLASASMAIGEASNLAQLALTYSFNNEDPKYKMYTCILAVLAQVAIDNAKRAYDIDLVKEIKRIKQDMDIEENGLPLFWFYIKRKGKWAKSTGGKQIMKNYNPSLVCPMNYLCEVEFSYASRVGDLIPISHFIIDTPLSDDKRPARRVEQFIEKYSIDCFWETINSESHRDEIDLYQLEFEELLYDIRRLYINKDYQALMVWLLKRAFRVGADYHVNKLKNITNNNRTILIKTLYTLNSDVFLSCFRDKADMKIY